MKRSKIPTRIATELSRASGKMLEHDAAKRIDGAKSTVLGRYQPMFAAENLSKLTKEDFQSFLRFENNQHWNGLHRQGSNVTASMPKLRKALHLLADDTTPINERLDQAMPLVRGMGKGIATAVLLVMHPDKYGVWNNTSEAALADIGLWPDFPRGTSMGKKYEVINGLLLELASLLKQDLWTLDILMWRLVEDVSGTDQGSEQEPDGNIELSDTTSQRFGLERHLHEFMRDNWSQLDIGKQWQLYSEHGDDTAGYEYPTSIGRIDLLAKHKRKPEWLVIELKRNQTDDQTVGQILRYMGWVRMHLAAKKDAVLGMVVAHDGSDKIKYALETVPDIILKLYKVEFSLHNPEK